MEKIKIALKERSPKESRLTYLQRRYTATNGTRKLKTEAGNFPMEILLRDDDIPQYVEQGVADIGILGQTRVGERQECRHC